MLEMMYFYWLVEPLVAGLIILIIYNTCHMMAHAYVNTSLQLVEEIKVKQSVTAELTLLNTLPERLRDCSFTIEGVGLTEGKPITEKYINRFLSVSLPSPYYLRVLLE